MKKLLIGSLLVLGSLVVLVVAVQAVSKDDIIFPVAELGDCRSESDCRAYCDRTENIRACIAFAKKHNLMSSSEAERALRFAQIAEQGGPGGCRSKDECKTYCDNPNNIEACLAFAEEHGLMPPQEVAEAKKVAAALRAGATLPGNCKSKEECRAYCADSAHADECLAFAEKAGFISSEEAAKAKKFLPLMARGETPGGCKSKEECESYCSNSEHFDECVAFAEKAGFITAAEAERAKQAGRTGPGGCQSKEECETFCNQPENRETCFKFAADHDLIEPEKIQEMKEGTEKLKQGISTGNPGIEICLKSSVGPEIIEQIKAGTLTPGPEIGERVRACFEKFDNSGKGSFSSGPSESSGPGDKESPDLYREQFEKYKEHYDKIIRPVEEMRKEMDQNDAEDKVKIEEEREDSPEPDKMDESQTRGQSLIASVLNLLTGLIVR
ncbi:MAG: hypothetical protein HYS89_01065 [Candidatus Colwellbacteria bacterium]|nr:hypothetical protein [Candidatus Colwellbacteria bacterium]